MTKTWTFIAFFKLLVVLVLAVVYRPDLNTGYASDSYAYMAAVAFFGFYSTVPYLLMAMRHSQSLGVSTPRLVYSTWVLLLSWLLILIFFIFSILNQPHNYQTFWVLSLVTVFVVFFLFFVINRITEISAESETTQELNLCRRESFARRIDDFSMRLPKNLLGPDALRALNKLKDEVRLIPAQTKGIDFTRFNAVMSELETLSQSMTTTPAGDDSQTIQPEDRIIELMNRASTLLSSIKSN